MLLSVRHPPRSGNVRGVERFVEARRKFWFSRPNCDRIHIDSYFLPDYVD